MANSTKVLIIVLSFCLIYIIRRIWLYIERWQLERQPPPVPKPCLPTYRICILYQIIEFKGKAVNPTAWYVGSWYLAAANINDAAERAQNLMRQRADNWQQKIIIRAIAEDKDGVLAHIADKIGWKSDLGCLRYRDWKGTF